MSVLPDRLLTSAVEVPSRSTPARPASTSEPAPAEASSFSQVYQRERQSKTGEARDKAPADEPRRPEKTADRSESASKSSPEAKAEVAEGGNLLPEEPLAETDPLLLLGLGEAPLGEQGETDDPLLGEDESAEGQTLTSDAGLLPNLFGTTGLDPARVDPQREKLNSAAAVKITLEHDGEGETEAALTDDKLTAGGKGTGLFQAGLQQLAGLEESANEAAEPLLETAEGVGEARGGESFSGRLNLITQQIQAANPAARALPQVPGAPVNMQQPGWSEAVTDRVMWLSSQNLKSAEIQLDPAELGRLEVRISLNQDGATQVTFVSPHGQVRDALESQMYRLRELFAQQGMNQLDVNVSDQSLQRGAPGEAQAGKGGSGRVSGEAEDEELAAQAGGQGSELIRTGRGLVDYYA